VVFVVLQGLVPAPALAAGGGDGCNPWSVDSSRQKNDYVHGRFDGETVSDDPGYGGQVQEAKGAVEDYSPWVSQGLDNGTAQFYAGSDVSGWVMLAQANQRDTYVQGGWREFYQGHRFNFAEMDVPGKPQADWWFNPDAINTTHWWDVQFNQGTIDPTTQPMYTVEHDGDQPVWLRPPDADYQFIPDAAEMYHETHATADQEPGGYNNHAWMGFLEIASSSNASLHVGSSIRFFDDWAGSPTTGWYGLQTFSDNSLQTWDWACSN
jgi:hypothetical protein